MAVNYEDVLPTPENYATPKQLEAARDYAKALLYGKKQQEPITHWSQGVSNVVNALYGGKDLYDAKRDENLTRQAQLRGVPINTLADNGAMPGAGAVPRGFVAPQDEGAPTGPRAPMSGASGMGRDYRPGIEPDNSPLYEDNPIPVPGVPLPRPRPPNAPGMPGAVNDRMGPFGNPPPGAPAPDRTSALPFGGTPVGPGGPMDAQSAIMMALQKGAGKGPFGAPPQGAPPGGVDYVDPRTVQTRPVMTRDMLYKLMGSDLLGATPAGDALQKSGIGTYFEQGQPQTVDTTGGKVIIDPKSGAQRFVPDIKWGTEKVGDVETQEGYVVRPDGKGGFIKMKIRPDRAPAAPTTPSSGAPVDGPSVPTIKSKPNQFAPTEGIDKTGLPKEITGDRADAIPGMLGFAPPDTTVSGKGLPPALPDGLVKTAQAVDPDIQEKADWSQARKLDFERQKHYNTKDIDAAEKQYDNLSVQGQTAAQTKSQLELARSMVEDPRLYQGVGSDIAKLLKQAQVLFGGDPEAASRMETFEKIISGQIVQDLKTQLQGLGQVRVAEIDLLSKAAASTNRTQPANRAVLELMIRTHDQIENLAAVARDYKLGYRFDKDGNAVMSANRDFSKAGMDAALARYIKANPILTPKERANYEFLFKNVDKAKYESTKKQLEDAQAGRSQGSGTSGTGVTIQPPPAGFK